MAEETEKAVPWYQAKKWVISAGLVCGVGLGALLLEPVVDDIVPILFSESASEPAAAESESVEPGAAEAGDTTDSTNADGDADGDGTSDDNPDAPAEDESGNAGQGQSDGPYELVIIGTEDVSVDETIFKVVTAELNLYPIDKDKLRDALDKEIDQFRGEAHAVSVKVFFDHREGVSPAFGAWNWAPDGEWSKAEEGDPDTWDDYEWKEPETDKFESPDSCAPPSEAELILSGAYYDMAEAAAPQDAEEVAPEGDPVEEIPVEDEPVESEPAEGEPVEGEPETPDPEETPDPPDSEVPPDPQLPLDPQEDSSQVDDSEDEVAVNTFEPDTGAMDTVAAEVGTTIELLGEALAITSDWVAC